MTTVPPLPFETDSNEETSERVIAKEIGIGPPPTHPLSLSLLDFVLFVIVIVVFVVVVNIFFYISIC